MVNFELLKKFLVVCKHNNLTTASNELYITQPALTKSIKELEELLNVQLFKRTSKGMILTSSGEFLKQNIELPFAQIQNALDLLQNNNETQQKITIGTSITIAKNYLPQKLSKLADIYPNLKIEIKSVSLNSAENNGIEMLNNEKVDIIVSNQEVKMPNLKCVAVQKLHDVFICGTKYQGLCYKNINLDKLLEFPLILNEKGSVTRKSFDSFCKENNISANATVEVEHNTLLTEMVKLNMGIGYSTKEFITDELQSNNLFILKTNATLPTRNLYITYKNNSNLNELQTFISILKNV